MSEFGECLLCGLISEVRSCGAALAAAGLPRSNRSCCCCLLLWDNTPPVRSNGRRTEVWIGQEPKTAKQ